MKVEHINFFTKRDSSAELRVLYNHIEKNFGKLAEPFVLHSLDFDFVAGVWSMLYETVLVEINVNRTIKEFIAVAVSETNKCPYCVEAHDIMALTMGESAYAKIDDVKSKKANSKTKEDRLILWALNNLKYENREVSNPPFSPIEAPEIIGTAVLFHYINRMVTIFAGDSPLPTARMKNVVKGFAANFVFKKAINKPKKRGDSLRFLENIASENFFEWAKPIPEIQTSFRYFKFQTETKIEKILSQEFVVMLKKQSKNLQWLEPVLGNSNQIEFTNNFNQSEQETAKFCYLVMFEPHKVQEKQIFSLKKSFTEKQILQITAFSAFVIAENIGEMLSNSQ